MSFRTHKHVAEHGTGFQRQLTQALGTEAQGDPGATLAIGHWVGKSPERV